MTTAWLVVLAAGRAARPRRGPGRRVARRITPTSSIDANAVPLFGLAAAMLIGAWIAIGRAPESRRGRLRAPLVAGAGSLLVTLIAFLAVLLRGRSSSGAAMPQALWLGGERSLTFAPARGLNADRAATDAAVHTSGPARRLADPDVLSEEFVVRPGPWMRGPWPNPAPWRRHRAALLRRSAGCWSSTMAQRRRSSWCPRAQATAVGWSPSGDRFAWLHRRVGARERIWRRADLGRCPTA